MTSFSGYTIVSRTVFSVLCNITIPLNIYILPATGSAL